MKLLGKTVIVLGTGLFLAVMGTVSVRAESIGEIPVAGISVAMDKYYTLREHSDKSVIQAMSIYEDYGDNLGIADVTNHLNIRKGPSEQDDIVGKLPKDAACYVYEINDDGWARISSGGVSGYVASEFLILGDEANAYALKVGFYAALVQVETMNVRMEPSIDSKKLTQVAKGEFFEVVEDKTIGSEWVKVMIDSDTGYVNSEYVDITYRLKRAVKDSVVKEDAKSGVTSLRARMVSYAKQFIGYPYVYGGNSLTNGIDCSGFTKAIYASYGYSLNRTAATQCTQGTSINFSDIRPGDLVFYTSGGRVSHVAMYIGNGQIVHASNRRDGIKISNMYYMQPYRVKRIIND